MPWLELLSSVLAGALLGVFFFGGLWWTVNNLAGARRPALLVLVSFTLRTGVLLGGFYLLLTGAAAGSGWPPLLAALAGFVIVRLAAMFLARPERTPAAGAEKGEARDDH